MAIKYSNGANSMNWSANTWGQVTSGGVYVQAAKTLTPAVSPGWTINALNGLKCNINGSTVYTIASNTASSFTITAAGPANGTYNWAVFNESPPGDGDTAYVNGPGKIVVMDIATIPESGTLAELGSKTIVGLIGTAYLSCVTTNAIFHSPGGVINATLMNGSGNYLIDVTGNDPTHLLTINCPTINGGGGTGGPGGAIGVSCSTPVVVNGDIYGGGVGGHVGLYVSHASANVIVNGNITAVDGGGLYFGNAGGTVVVTGNITAGDAQYGLDFWGPGDATCASIIGSPNSAGGVIRTDGSLTVTTGGIVGGESGGDITGYGFHIMLTGSGVVTVEAGGVTGGSGETSYGIYNQGTATITVEAGGVTGGSGVSSYGIYNKGDGIVTIAGGVTGGSNTSAIGVYNEAAGSITVESGGASGGTGVGSTGVYNKIATGVVSITGNITGGSGASACGVNNVLTGVVTLETTDAILTNGSGGVAYTGYPPVWVPTGTATIVWNGESFVLGDTYPIEDDVRNGTIYAGGGAEGNLVIPDPADVRLGVNFDTSGLSVGGLDLPSINDVRDDVVFDNTTKTGLLNLPIINDVRITVSYDNGTKLGIMDLPLVADVRDTVTFDNATKTGLLDLPLESDVADGVTYDNGTKIGELVAESNSPLESDVRFGIIYGPTLEYVGNLIIPIEDNVRRNIHYGSAAEYTGNLRLPAERDVELGVMYGAEGTEYLGTFRAPLEEDVQYGCLYGGDSTEYIGSLVPYF
jgi:hypothetical protein